MITLTDEERTKFADWLEADAKATKAMSEKAASLGVTALADQFSVEAAAEMLVIKRLRCEKH